MISCPVCSRNKKQPHAEKNMCACGAVFDGRGNLIGDAPPIDMAKPVSRKKFNHFNNKPGSALESIIPKWAAQFAKGCGCKDMRIKMDRWGTTGCLHREDTIIAHLMQQPEKVVAIFKNIPMPIRRAAARRLFQKAIALSKQE